MIVHYDRSKTSNTTEGHHIHVTQDFYTSPRNTYRLLSQGAIQTYQTCISSFRGKETLFLLGTYTSNIYHIYKYNHIPTHTSKILNKKVNFDYIVTAY